MARHELNNIIFYENENNRLHREEGPAWENTITGRQEWWLNGQRHRNIGPAVIEPFHKEWWVDDKLHNGSGPAVIYYNKEGGGIKEEAYYLKGDYVLKTDWEKEKNKKEQIEIKKYGNCISYTKNGKYHREDGPAWENILTGRKDWFINDKRHRIGGPAISEPGYEAYYQNDRLHNTEGPAILKKIKELIQRSFSII